MLSFLHDGAIRIYILHEIITKLKILVFLNLYFPTFKFSFLKAKYLCSFRYFFSNLPTILSKLLTQFMTNMSMLYFSWELNKQPPPPPPTHLLVNFWIIFPTPHVYLDPIFTYHSKYFFYLPESKLVISIKTFQYQNFSN